MYEITRESRGRTSTCRRFLKQLTYTGQNMHSNSTTLQRIIVTHLNQSALASHGYLIDWLIPARWGIHYTQINQPEIITSLRWSWQREWIPNTETTSPSPPPSSLGAHTALYKAGGGDSRAAAQSSGGWIGSISPSSPLYDCRNTYIPPLCTLLYQRQVHLLHAASMLHLSLGVEHKVYWVHPWLTYVTCVRKQRSSMRHHLCGPGCWYHEQQRHIAQAKWPRTL